MKKDTTTETRGWYAQQEKKSENFTPKIEPLRAGILQQYKKCGRPNCKCVNGSRHGPYTYIVWMVRGKRYKKYVKKDDLEQISARILAHKRQREKDRESKKSFGQVLWALRLEAKIQRAGIRKIIMEVLSNQ